LRAKNRKVLFHNGYSDDLKVISTELVRTKKTIFLFAPKESILIYQMKISFDVDYLLLP